MDSSEPVPFSRRNFLGRSGLALASSALPLSLRAQEPAVEPDENGPETLRYYEILNAYKCAVMDLSSAIIAGKNSNNHQDLLITWLASAGAVFLDQIEKLMRGA